MTSQKKKKTKVIDQLNCHLLRYICRFTFFARKAFHYMESDAVINPPIF